MAAAVPCCGGKDYQGEDACGHGFGLSPHVTAIQGSFEFKMCLA